MLSGLREQRGRTIMTLMGLAWGTFSVVALLAFGTGLQRMLHENLSHLGRGIAVVWPQQTTKSFEGMGRGRSVKLKAADVEALPGQIPELELISPEYIASERIELGPRVHRATIAGVYPAYGELRSWDLARGGRFLNDLDMAEKRRVVVLGNGIKEALLGRGEAVGRRVVLRGIPFTVVGVMKPKEQDSDYEGRDERRVCMPASTFEQVFGARYLADFVYRARALQEHARATDRIYQILGRLCRFDPSDRLALHIWDTNETERIRYYVFLGFNLMLGGSGALTLLVGGVGVGNLMFIRVRQRTREIGIQMALGAHPRWILWSVLSEALLLSGLGGAIGFVMSWIATTLVAMTPLTRDIGRPQISFAIAGITVALLGTVGLLAGYFPARRAARLDPVLAMADLST
jgi:putative ABC transport system permease protein